MTANNASPRIALKLGLGVAVVAAVAAGAFFWLREDATFIAVYRGTAVDAVSGSIEVHASGDLKELKSEGSGRVESCEHLDQGQSFKKGDVLVKLDATDQRRAIDQAIHNDEAAWQRREIEFSDNPEWTAVAQKLDEARKQVQPGEPASVEMNRLRAQLDEIESRTDPRRKAVERNLENAKRLHDHGDLSEADWDRQQKAVADLDKELRLAAFDAAKARADHETAMENMRLQLKKMTIVAPEDGTAAAVMVWPGALINTGTTVATFNSNSRVVVAKISEEDFGKIKVGQDAKVRLVIYAREDPFDAKVSKIMPTADPDTQRYTVLLDVAVDPARLVLNSSGQVNITVGEHPSVMLIPRRAVFRGEGDNVYVVKNGRVERRKVTLGYTSLNTVEVASGLAVGEQVICENVRQFDDGQYVRASPLK